MIIGRCKDCAYWGRYRNNVCDAIELGEAPGLTYIEVRVSDDSGLDAYLVTEPDFGCAKFVKKRP